MIMTLFYISGFITALALVGYFRYKSLYKKLLKKENDKDELIASLSKYKSERESKKRRARLITEKWHKESDENNPKRREWDVVFELKEVAQSADDPKKYKFDVTEIFWEDNDDDDYEFYHNWFLGHTGGGWIHTDNKNFEWMTTLTKEDIRDDKLSGLGI